MSAPGCVCLTRVPHGNCTASVPPAASCAPQTPRHSGSSCRCCSPGTRSTRRTTGRDRHRRRLRMTRQYAYIVSYMCAHVCESYVCALCGAVVCSAFRGVWGTPHLARVVECHTEGGACWLVCLCLLPRAASLWDHKHTHGGCLECAINEAIEYMLVATCGLG